VPRKRMGYATGTTVDTAKTMQDIVAVLRRNGAKQHFFGEDHQRAIVGFSMHDRQVRLTIPYPDEEGQRANFNREAEVRRRWRCLLLSVKAKFENVASAESVSPEYADQVFRAEFLADTVLSDGKTVGEIVMPMIAKNYAGGPPRLALPEMGK
jgi:hypothetical protein